MTGKTARSWLFWFALIAIFAAALFLQRAHAQTWNLDPAMYRPPVAAARPIGDGPCRSAGQNMVRCGGYVFRMVGSTLTLVASPAAMQNLGQPPLATSEAGGGQAGPVVAQPSGPGKVAFPPPPEAVFDEKPVKLAMTRDTGRPPVPPDWADVEVSFTPLSLASSEASTGPGREAGTWLVASCNMSATRVSIPRAMILNVSPSIRWLPDGNRQLLLERRTRQSPWRIVGSFLKTYGTIGAAAAGFAFSGFTAGAGAGLGAELVKQSIEKGLATAEANTVEYRLFKPIPEVVVIEPLSCAEHDLLSSLVPKAAKHRGRIGQ